jgi:hypothetical protein
MIGPLFPRSVVSSFAQVVVAVAVLGLPGPADAGLIVAVPTSIDPLAGYFDLTIRNDGTPMLSAQIGGDSIRIDIQGGSGVRFTGASIGTSLPYLFQPSFDADFGLSLVSSLSDTSITIADNADNAAGFATVGPNDLFGLARIFFSVDLSAGPSMSTIAIIPSDSSLSGPALDNAPAIAFTSRNGTLINPGVVPEPSTLVLVLIAGGCIAARRAGRSRPLVRRESE